MQRIEKSAFRKGEYVGYAAGVWNIRKTNSTYGNWIARKNDSPNTTLYGMTLAALDRKLDEWERSQGRVHNPVKRRGPFPKGKTPPHLKRYLFKKGR